MPINPWVIAESFNAQKDEGETFVLDKGDGGVGVKA